MRRAVGVCLIGLALVISLVGLGALLDPVGTKLADDGDPFGDPGSPLAPVVLLAAGLVLGAGGIWLARSRRPPPRDRAA
jgi:hypothetical protein